jgi:hypothetical protein
MGFYMTLISFASVTALGGGLALAQTSTPNSMMRADGTMTSSPGLTRLSQEMSAALGCRAAARRLQLASPKAGGHRCFMVRIDNISSPNAFTASNGTTWTLPFSPGPFIVTSKPHPIFSLGTADRGQGLRALSEDGNPVPLTSYAERTFPGSGAFLVPVGGTKPKGIVPGQHFQFFVVAEAGQKLHFASMFGQSNDWFYGTPSGIALFDAGGKPLGGNATAQIKLFDAGTEADEELGIGPSQGPRQPHPRFGPPDAKPGVTLATSDSRFIDVTKVMRVTVTPQ